MSNLQSEYILSRFKEPKLLSDSGKSQVYMVLDVATNRPYIQKVFQKDTDMEVYRQMQSLAPRNIPKIHHIIEGETHIYIIEEYISGTRLDELIGNYGKFDTTQVVAWVLSLCDTLEQLHDADPPIIHRDIKPSNIIIADDGTPKLIDFNISRNYKDGGASDTKALGTEYYAAPEQFGFAQTDNRTDIYALGKLMITLLTGRQQAPEDGHDGYRQIKPIILKCCAVDPVRRYRNVTELRSALAPTKANRSKRIIGVLALCAVIALCYFGYQRLGKSPQTPPANGTYNPSVASDIDDISAPATTAPVISQPLSEEANSPTPKQPLAEEQPQEPDPPKEQTQETEPPQEQPQETTQTQEPDSSGASTPKPLTTPEPIPETPAVPDENTYAEPRPSSLPSWAYMPKPIFGLQDEIDEADDVADVLDRVFLTDTVKYLLGGKYDYFIEQMAAVEGYRYEQTSKGYMFYYQEPQNNNASDAFLEINDNGEVYIGLHDAGTTYYYTNNPDYTSELHFNYLFFWFNFHGDSHMVFADMSSRTLELSGFYTFEEYSQELTVTQQNDTLEYTVNASGNEMSGTATQKGDYFEAYIEDYGYLYFHFYDDCVFVFDKLLKSAAGNAVNYVGKYKKQ